MSSTSSIQSTIKVVEKSRFFMKTEQKRLELVDLFNKKIDVAARDLKAGESIDKLGFWTRLFWVPTTIKNADGTTQDILLNRNSILKNFKKAGYSLSKQEVLSKAFGSLNDFMIEKITSKIVDDIIENNVELAFLNGLSARSIKYRLNTENAVKDFIKNFKSYFPEGEDAVTKSFGISFETVLTSRYNPIDNKRNITLKIQGEEYSLYKLNAAINHAENRKIRSQFFAKIDTAKSELALSDSECRDIINFLVDKDREFLTDHLITDPSSPKALRVRNITYPIEYKKSDTRLARTIVVLNAQEICLVGSHKKTLFAQASAYKKEILGKGSFKRVKKIVNICNGALYACAKKKPGAFGPSELALKHQFKTATGVAKLVAETPSRVIETKYDQDLCDTSDLSFKEKIGLLESIFKGLKALHDAGIIHRDIKPANILMRKDAGGKVVADLSDLGLSINKNELEAQFWAGTPYYMPPEYRQAANSNNRAATKLHTNESYDIYSLGLTLREVFSDYLNGTIALSFAESRDFGYIKNLIVRMTMADVADRAKWKEIKLELANVGVVV